MSNLINQNMTDIGGVLTERVGTGELNIPMSRGILPEVNAVALMHTHVQSPVRDNESESEQDMRVVRSEANGVVRMVWHPFTVILQRSRVVEIPMLFDRLRTPAIEVVDTYVGTTSGRTTKMKSMVVTFRKTVMGKSLTCAVTEATTSVEEEVVKTKMTSTIQSLAVRRGQAGFTGSRLTQSQTQLILLPTPLRILN